MRITDISLQFNVPENAIKILKILREQNGSLGFELDEVENKINLYADMIDFPDYANDYDDIEDFDDSVLEG